MTEFIESTKQAIRESGHKASDIEFIGDKTRQVNCGTWQRFRSDVEKALQGDEAAYQCGYEVCEDLIIAFNDSSLLYRVGSFKNERWEYMQGSKTSTKQQSMFVSAEKIVHPDGRATSILKIAIDMLCKEYRKQIEKQFGV